MRPASGVKAPVVFFSFFLRDPASTHGAQNGLVYNDVLKRGSCDEVKSLACHMSLYTCEMSMQVLGLDGGAEAHSAVSSGVRFEP